MANSCGTIALEKDLNPEMRIFLEDAFNKQLRYITTCVEQTLRREMSSSVGNAQSRPRVHSRDSFSPSSRDEKVGDSGDQMRQASTGSGKAVRFEKPCVETDSVSCDTEDCKTPVSPGGRQTRAISFSDFLSESSSRPRGSMTMEEACLSVKSPRKTMEFQTVIELRDIENRQNQLLRQSSLRGPDTLHSRFSGAVQSTWFDGSVLVIIVLYTILLGFQADYGTQRPVQTTSDIYKSFEIIFCVLFTVEVVLKIFGEGCAFFVGSSKAWNVFTLVLVCLQITELITDALAGSSGQVNLLVIRFLRFLRLARVFRAIRVFSLVQELRTIVVSIVGSLRHVCWTILVLLMVAYVVAVCITQMVGDTYDYCDGSEGPGQSCPEEIQEYFGNLGLSSLTLFASVAGGVDWHKCMLDLLANISPIAGCLLLLYITFVVFALVNAVTGVFVESALRSAEASQKGILASMANSIFKKADRKKAGSINRDEFLTALHSDEMQTYFKTIDVAISDAEKVFDIIDIDESGTIEVDEFVSGVFRLKGPAKALDFVAFLRVWQSAQEHMIVELTELRSVVDDVKHKSARRSYNKEPQPPTVPHPPALMSADQCVDLELQDTPPCDRPARSRLMDRITCEPLCEKQTQLSKELLSMGPPPTKPTLSFCFAEQELSQA
eukprot:TRINITY_DN45015_c0_g1_i1.p1 TRINITY_DN45015_c0_g1~~TRINITY_DN45015_c0_g1_i1.p1  ORF type:complete len:664 (+),score=95.39 TRINITY_DN45015_c0_g1_i1:65-2056(+)